MSNGLVAQPMQNEVLFHLGPAPVTKVVVVTWGVMGFLLLCALLLRLRLRRKDPGRAQQALEAALEWLAKDIRDIVGRDPAPFMPLIGSLFVFILGSNLSSYPLSFFTQVMPPTADINTTAALAAVVFLAVPAYGIAMTGTWHYLKSYVRPVWIMLPFNILSELSRTVALAVRLFGNILSGEILIGVLLSIVPFLLPLPLMFLALITGTIQAYIFTILSIVYIGGAVRVVEKKEQQGETV